MIYGWIWGYMLQYIKQTQIRAVQRDMDQSQQTTSCKKVVLQEVAIGNLLLESPKMGRLAVNFRVFFWASAVQNPAVYSLNRPSLLFLPSKPGLFPCFFSWPSSPRPHPPSHAEGHHQQSNLRGRTQSNAQRKVHLVLQSHIHLGARWTTRP